MNTIIEQIEAMDKKSEEFFEVYKAVADKYFSFEEPNDLQQAAMTLHILVNHGEDWHVVITAKLAEQLYAMVEQDCKALHGVFGAGDKEVFFDFYTDKKALSKTHSMLMEAALGVAKTGNKDDAPN
jgi:hypothetical protein